MARRGGLGSPGLGNSPHAIEPVNSVTEASSIYNHLELCYCACSTCERFGEKLSQDGLLVTQVPSCCPSAVQNHWVDSAVSLCSERTETKG